MFHYILLDLCGGEGYRNFYCLNALKDHVDSLVKKKRLQDSITNGGKNKIKEVQKRINKLP